MLVCTFESRSETLLKSFSFNVLLGHKGRRKRRRLFKNRPFYRPTKRVLGQYWEERPINDVAEDNHHLAMSPCWPWQDHPIIIIVIVGVHWGVLEAPSSLCVLYYITSTKSWNDVNERAFPRRFPFSPKSWYRIYMVESCGKQLWHFTFTFHFFQNPSFSDKALFRPQIVWGKKSLRQHQDSSD